MHNRHFLLQQFHFHQINLLDSMLHSHHIIYFMHKPNCSSDCAHNIFSWISEQQLILVYKNRVTFVQFHTSFKLNCDKKIQIQMMKIEFDLRANCLLLRYFENSNKKPNIPHC